MLEFRPKVYVMSKETARDKAPFGTAVRVVTLSPHTHPLSEAKQVYAAYTEMRTVVVVYATAEAANAFFDAFLSRYARLPAHALVEARAIHNALLVDV
jgi:hypothetical protein